MRIIAGERRGHKFDGPDVPSTRPTSDFVRESIFNILGTRVEDRPVFDLFAGAGGLGLEALSRGAAQALFIEKDRRNAALIRRNLATLRFEDRGGVLQGDAYKWARSFEPDGDRPAIVFIDPPYRDFLDQPRRVREALENLCARLPQDSTLVIESDRRQDPVLFPRPEHWDIRRYGGTQIAILDLTAEGEAASGPSEDRDAP